MLRNVTPITLAEAVSASVPDPDHILGPLQPGDIGIISGADGSGKSLVALAMGASVAYGVPACGVVDAPRSTGRVLYVAGEDRRDDHIRRLKRLAAHLKTEHGISGDDDAMLTLWPLLGQRMPLFAPLGDGFKMTPLGEHFAAAIAGYRLVVLDPMRMMHDCEESKGPAMDGFARWLVTVAIQNQCAILLVQHASQGAILEGRTDHHIGRGATDFPAACRAAWALRTMTTKEAEDFRINSDERRDWRLLVQGKASHATEDGARWLKRDGGLWIRSSYTPEEVADANANTRHKLAAPARAAKTFANDLARYGLRPLTSGAENV